MQTTRTAASAPQRFALPVLLLALAATPPAQAQPADAEAVDEVVVTGSRLIRRDFFSPSPISTVDRVALDAATQPTLEETLNQMPQIVPDLERTANNGSDGTARVNLRGLGSNRTLVLLNGRRFAPSGVGSSVDLNNLPQLLIDRVEIVTGGATTVYGSDAVAGVVNFVTRSDFEGFGADITGYATGRGDAEIYNLNLAFGHDFAEGLGNVTLYATYYDRSPLFASERSVTAVPIADADGVLRETGSRATPSTVITFPPVNFGNGPALTTFDDGGLPIEFRDPEDRYNFAPLNYLQTPLERVSGGALLNREFGDGSEFYAELGYARNESRQNLAPVPVTDLYFTNLDNPLLAPATQQFFATNYAPPFLPPNTAGLFLSRRLEELGARIFDRERDYWRVVSGLRGALGSDWHYDVWFTYTRNEERTALQNGASRARFQQGLLVNPSTGQCFDASGGCAPLNIWGAGNLDAAGVAFLRQPTLTNATLRKQKLLSGFIRGAPFNTSAGPVEVAVGAEWRGDSGFFRSDPALSSGEALGFRGSAGVDGRETVYEIYTEALVPLLADLRFAQRLSLELGARFASYDNAGSAEAYKLGAEWIPIERLRFRAMLQRSVRAPSLTEAFQEQFSETFAYVASNPAEDPCSASADPVGRGNTDACIATGLPASQIGVFEAAVGIPTSFVRGGNPNLKPEEADTVTVGAVASFGREDEWRLSVDYFDLEIADTIGDLESTVACFDPANVQNRFCENFTRDPVNFNVIELVETKNNLGGQRTAGFDTQLSYRAAAPNFVGGQGSGAELSANLVWTHTTRNDVRQLTFGTRLRCAGQFGFPCTSATEGLSFPEDRVIANVAYSAGELGLYLKWRWIRGTDNAAQQIPAFTGGAARDLAIPSVGARSYFDLGAGFEFSDRLYARLNVSNVFDERPPLMADAVTSNNTDTRLYDVFGRAFSLTFSYRR